MKRLLISTIVFSLGLNLASAAPVQSLNWIGMVELPSIFGSQEAEGPPGAVSPTKPARIKIYSQPKAQSKIIATISSADEIESREHAYELSSAIVYARANGWYLIGLPRDHFNKGWIGPTDAGKFRSLAELLEEGLTYLTEDWDRQILNIPGTSDARPVAGQNPKDTRENSENRDKEDVPEETAKKIPVKLLETRVIGETLWLHIAVFDSICEVSTPKQIDQGWIPAHAKNGRPTVWFYSRGC